MNEDRSSDMMLAAVYMRVQQNLTQEVIADALGTGQGRISQLLEHAKQERLYFAPEAKLNRKIFTEDTIRAISRSILPPEAQRTIASIEGLSDALHTVRVVRTRRQADDYKSAKSYDAGKRILGQCFTADIRSYCESSRVTAVAWGGAVGAVVAAVVARAGKPKRCKSPRTIIPMLGEPVGIEDTTGASASRLAGRLNWAINGRTDNAYSLSGIAAIVPKGFRGEKLDTIKEFLTHSEVYRKIFGPVGGDPDNPRLLANQAQCVITSFSQFGRPWWTDGDTFCRTAKLDRAALNDIALGDIGGVLIKRDNLTHAQRRLYNDLLNRWTGFRWNNLRQCAERARADKKLPGVVAIGLGGKRAPVLYRLIQKGLINRLYIDHILLRELQEYMDAQP